MHFELIFEYIEGESPVSFLGLRLFTLSCIVYQKDSFPSQRHLVTYFCFPDLLHILCWAPCMRLYFWIKYIPDSISYAAHTQFVSVNVLITASLWYLLKSGIWKLQFVPSWGLFSFFIVSWWLRLELGLHHDGAEKRGLWEATKQESRVLTLGRAPYKRTKPEGSPFPFYHLKAQHGCTLKDHQPEPGESCLHWTADLLVPRLWTSYALDLGEIRFCSLWVTQLLVFLLRQYEHWSRGLWNSTWILHIFSQKAKIGFDRYCIKFVDLFWQH